MSAEGADLELACLCGSENFERVVVERRPHPPIVTDFVACVSCRTMFYVPKRQYGNDPEFKNDAVYASGAYRKPGRRQRRSRG